MQQKRNDHYGIFYNETGQTGQATKGRYLNPRFFNTESLGEGMAALNPEENVSPKLLYAMTDEEIVPDEDYQMSGNQISVKTLDLGQDFSFIKEQLDRIVTEFFTELG